ncbi:hypothetical protein [Streptomyces sp. NPDC003635]
MDELVEHWAVLDDEVERVGECIEPPSAERVMRMVSSVLHTAEASWFAAVAVRLPAEVRAWLMALVAADGADGTEDGEVADPGRESVLALVKTVPENVRLESMLREIRRLTAIRAIVPTASLFADVAPRVLASWPQRAAVVFPSHLRRREREVTDALVDLLIATVHRIGARGSRLAIGTTVPAGVVR